MSDYIPIDCGLYNNYELAVIRRQRLRMAWRTPEGIYHLETLLPINLQTRDHAEYLLVKNTTGSILELRLDHIIRAELFLSRIAKEKALQSD